MQYFYLKQMHFTGGSLLVLNKFIKIQGISKYFQRDGVFLLLLVKKNQHAKTTIGPLSFGNLSLCIGHFFKELNEKCKKIIFLNFFGIKNRRLLQLYLLKLYTTNQQVGLSCSEFRVFFNDRASSFKDKLY